MDVIAANLAQIQAEIRAAELKFHRPPHSVKLLAVSKGQSIAKINAAIAAGQFCFGENYLQEALAKIATITAAPCEWHFIGNVQANKTKAIAENFAWVHSVCRHKIAERLQQQRPPHLPPLNVCIEINLSNEKTKSGIHLNELLPLAKTIVQLPRLQLRGLMAIPEFNPDFIQQRAVYHKMQQALTELQVQGIKIDTLSMGMSQDFIAAIAAGSTMVRIGTAIFGSRK